MKMLKETKFVLSILNKQSIEENFELFLKYFYGTEITDPEAKREKYFSALNSIQNNSISVADRGINIEENSNNDLHKYLLSTNMMPVEKLTTSNDSMTIRKNIINALDLIIIKYWTL